jgi:hypothetical protein
VEISFVTPAFTADALPSISEFALIFFDPVAEAPWLARNPLKLSSHLET